MNKEIIQEELQKLRDLISKSYEIAGDLRDYFSDLPEACQHEFKQPCNDIRFHLSKIKDI